MLVVVSAMAAGALGSARAQGATAEAGSTGSTRIMIVGDSITHGSTGDYTWRYRLWQHLRSAGEDVDLVGPRTDLWNYLRSRPGDQRYAVRGFDRDHRARWGDSYTRLAPEIRGMVAAHQPDYLVVELGFNDLLWCCSPERTLELLRAFLDEVYAASPGVVTIVTTVPSTRLAAAPAFNDLLLASEPDLRSEHPGVIVADTAAGFRTRRHTFDGTHPNANGELVIAAGVADALAEVGVGTPAQRPLPVLPVGPSVASVLRVRAGDREAILRWRPAPGATRHFVWVRGPGGRRWTRLPHAVTGRSRTIGGLVNGRRYTFRVQAAKVRAVSPLRSLPVRVVPHR